MSTIFDLRLTLSLPEQEMIRRGLELLADRNTFVGHCRNSENLKDQVEGEEYWPPAHIKEINERFGGERPTHPTTPLGEEE